ncbi:MAG: hypothetical protein M0Z67_03710 [Nitrospiraceae bacterium]|nr:hypothetical protein [Nitrospiraceae bacterium]
MNIISIQESLLSQNATRPTGKNDSAADDKLRPAAVQSGPDVPIVSSGASKAPQVAGLTAGIDYTKEQLDTILVSYPPFFPLGTYQRLDLIRQVQGLQDEVHKSSIDTDLKKSIAGSKLSEHATDQEISAALDGLFGLRKNLAGDKSASGKTQPGAILDIKV